ncbi:MAG: CDP-alcohol phosphatidyltransferase family protein [Parvibaculales bacterium]
MTQKHPNPKAEEKKLSMLSIRRLVPNALTLGAICLALTALRLGIDGRFKLAVLSLIAAGFLDGIDGRIARMLGAQSRMGAQLDSLADFFNFGITPVLLIYLWQPDSLQKFGWLGVLCYAVCGALRLARFHVDMEHRKKDPWEYNYFVGIPSPGAAGLVMLPLYLDFWGVPLFRDLPILISLYCAIIGLLMVSNIPTFSPKPVRFTIPKKLALPLLLLVTLAAGAVLTYPWVGLSVLCALYLSTLPWSAWCYAKEEEKQK